MAEETQETNLSDDERGVQHEDEESKLPKLHSFTQISPSTASSSLDLAPGENWLRLLEPPSNLLGESQSSEDNGILPSVLSLSDLGRIDAPSSDLWICLDVTGNVLALKDFRDPLLEDDKSEEDEESSSNNELEILISRGSILLPPCARRAVERRQLEILQPGDKIFLRRGDSDVLVLEYVYETAIRTTNSVLNSQLIDTESQFTGATDAPMTQSDAGGVTTQPSSQLTGGAWLAQQSQACQPKGISLGQPSQLTRDSQALSQLKPSHASQQLGVETQDFLSQTSDLNPLHTSQLESQQTVERPRAARELVALKTNSLEKDMKTTTPSALGRIAENADPMSRVSSAAAAAEALNCLATSKGRADVLAAKKSPESQLRKDTMSATVPERITDSTLIPTPALKPTEDENQATKAEGVQTSIPDNLDHYYPAQNVQDLDSATASEKSFEVDIHLQASNAAAPEAAVDSGVVRTDKAEEKTAMPNIEQVGNPPPEEHWLTQNPSAEEHDSDDCTVDPTPHLDAAGCSGEQEPLDNNTVKESMCPCITKSPKGESPVDRVMGGSPVETCDEKASTAPEQIDSEAQMVADMPPDPVDDVSHELCGEEEQEIKDGKNSVENQEDEETAVCMNCSPLGDRVATGKKHGSTEDPGLVLKGKTVSSSAGDSVEKDSGEHENDEYSTLSFSKRADFDVGALQNSPTRSVQESATLHAETQTIPLPEAPVNASSPAVANTDTPVSSPALLQSPQLSNPLHFDGKEPEVLPPLFKGSARKFAAEETEVASRTPADPKSIHREVSTTAEDAAGFAENAQTQEESQENMKKFTESPQPERWDGSHEKISRNSKAPTDATGTIITRESDLARKREPLVSDEKQAVGDISLCESSPQGETVPHASAHYAVKDANDGSKSGQAPVQTTNCSKGPIGATNKLLESTVSTKLSKDLATETKKLSSRSNCSLNESAILETVLGESIRSSIVDSFADTNNDAVTTKEYIKYDDGGKASAKESANSETSTGLDACLREGESTANTDNKRGDAKNNTSERSGSPIIQNRTSDGKEILKTIAAVPSISDDKGSSDKTLEAPNHSLDESYRPESVRPACHTSHIRRSARKRVPPSSLFDAETEKEGGTRGAEVVQRRSTRTAKQAHATPKPPPSATESSAKKRTKNTDDTTLRTPPPFVQESGGFAQEEEKQAATRSTARKRKSRKLPRGTPASKRSAPTSRSTGRRKSWSTIKPPSDNDLGSTINVLVTGIAVDAEIKNFVKKIGAALITDISKAHTATHVVVKGEEMSRTSKLMIGLCCTGRIVTREWLHASFKAERALPFLDYVALNERVMANVQRNLTSGKLLKGWCVYFCKGIGKKEAPPANELRLIVEAAGSYVVAEPSSSGTKLLVITSYPEKTRQRKECSAAIANGATKRTIKWFLDKMMAQELDID